MKKKLEQSEFNIRIEDLEHLDLVSTKALQEPLLQELDEPSMEVVIGGNGNNLCTLEKLKIKMYYARLGYYNIVAWGPC